MVKKKSASRSESRQSGPSAGQLGKQVDKLDRDILKLINERARTVQRMGKGESTQKGTVGAATADQEHVQQLLQASKGPLDERAVRTIFREIQSASRALIKTV